ncbi:MAG: GNAT family N-acetyltransferase [Propioniciclava sp.]
MVAVRIRRTEPNEYRVAASVVTRSLMMHPIDDQSWPGRLPHWEHTVSYSAWDGDTCVGHAAHYPVDTTIVGGGALTTGAVTRIGVLPTHTRQGIGSALVTAVVKDARERGWPLASLRASEATIYRRFGFGIAGDVVDLEIDPRRARPLRGAAPGRIRLIDPADALAVAADVYGRSRRRRPGLMTRPEVWSRRFFAELVEHQENRLLAVHVRPDGLVDGYVYYTTAPSGSESGGIGTVHDLVAVEPAAEIALWDYLCGIDLVRRWRAPMRPVDDLILAAATDRRACRVTSVTDEQWVRLVDVDAALTARRYASGSGDPLVIAVTDPLLDRNERTWRIGPEGADLTDGPPDLVLDIDALSALYLGGMSWTNEAAVGRIRPGVGLAGDAAHFVERLREGHRLFATEPLPYCGTFF